MNLRKLFLVLFAFGSFSMSAYAQKCVSIETKHGTMEVQLYDETPLHRDNFVKLVESGYYDGLLFHRVIKEFMIQGGDPDSKNASAGQALGTGGPGYTIPAEINKKFYHKKGVLSAARQGDQVNPQKRSSGSQFYIVQGRPFSANEINAMKSQRGMTFTPQQEKDYMNVGGSPWLDNEYTVFGEVTKGLDVIDKIAAEKVDQRDRPAKDVHMKMKMVGCPK